VPVSLNTPHTAELAIHPTAYMHTTASHPRALPGAATNDDSLAVLAGYVGKIITSVRKTPGNEQFKKFDDEMPTEDLARRPRDGRHTATALRIARIDLASPRKSGRDSADVGTSCSP
jgi:hypothetical protein